MSELTTLAVIFSCPSTLVPPTLAPKNPKNRMQNYRFRIELFDEAKHQYLGNETSSSSAGASAPASSAIFQRLNPGPPFQTAHFFS